MNDSDYVADNPAARNHTPDLSSAVRQGTPLPVAGKFGNGAIPLAAVPVRAPPANTVAVWPKAHPLVAETRDRLLHGLVDRSAFTQDDMERVDLSEVEPPPLSMQMAAVIADLEEEIEALRREQSTKIGGRASRAEARGWCVRRDNVRLVRFHGPPRGGPAARTDPDRPLLRLLNRASGKPVLVMCGRPGSRDPAHAAAGRLPVRFNKYSDLRLFWHEFPRRSCRLPASIPELQGFTAAIVMTNAAEPFIDASIALVMEAVASAGRPALWGEAAPSGGVLWHQNFAIRPIIDELGLRDDIRVLVCETEA